MSINDGCLVKVGTILSLWHPEVEGRGPPVPEAPRYSSFYGGAMVILPLLDNDCVFQLGDHDVIYSCPAYQISIYEKRRNKNTRTVKTDVINQEYMMMMVMMMLI